MKLGTENKKSVYALAVLGVVAAYMVYSAFFSSDSSAPPPATRTAALTERERAAAEISGAPAPIPAPSPASQSPVSPRQLGTSRSSSRNDEFHPTLRSKRKEDQIDPINIDPTLRLDLLAKVQDVKLDGGQRNLFQFGKAEPAPAALIGPETKIVPTIARARMGPEPYVEPPPPGPAVVPPPPPITMKYYGLATKRIDGKKTAFFLDGEDILLATEGMTVKRRYKIVRINPESVVILDTDVKAEQTVKIAEDAGGTV